MVEFDETWVVLPNGMIERKVVPQCQGCRHVTPESVCPLYQNPAWVWETYGSCLDYQQRQAP